MLRLAVQRILIFLLGAFAVWLIVAVVFSRADNRLPWYLAVGVTYGVSAYVILPNVLRMGLKILRRQSVPRYTVTADGLPGDPVNIALYGTQAQLASAFAKAGWLGSDALSLRSSLRMAVAFLANRAYPTAPFSTLFLFGRGQDIGFQKAINNSPRRRHHIRFWALPVHRAQQTVGSASFWLNTDRPDTTEPVLWIGAGTRDTGFSLTQMTFKVTHATDADTNAERDFIIAELRAARAIGDAVAYQSGDEMPLGRINHYIADGAVSLAPLIC